MLWGPVQFMVKSLILGRGVFRVSAFAVYTQCVAISVTGPASGRHRNKVRVFWASA